MKLGLRSNLVTSQAAAHAKLYPWETQGYQNWEDFDSVPWEQWSGLHNTSVTTWENINTKWEDLTSTNWENMT